MAKFEKKENKKNITLTLSESLIEKITKMADELNQSRSYIIEAVFRDFLDEEEDE